MSSQWLRLREPADAAARSSDLARMVVALLDGAAPTVVHDLGCGSGSMGRWLAPLLEGPQHWVLHDRDRDLLGVAAADPPRAGADGAPVTVETRQDDLTRLGPDDLAGASLLTASALLDMLTAEELGRFVRSCVGGRLSHAADPVGHRGRPAHPDGPPGCRAAAPRSTTTSDARPGVARSSGPTRRRRPSTPSAASGPGSRCERARGGWAPATSRWSRSGSTAGSGPPSSSGPSSPPTVPATSTDADTDLEHGRLAVTVPHLDLLALPSGAAA